MPLPEDPSTDPLLPLHGLVAIARLVREEAPIDELLDNVASIVSRTLGFRSVAVNLYRPEHDDFEVKTVVSDDPSGVELLLGETSGAQALPQLLVPRFEQHGTYFVPAGSFDWEALGVAVYQPPPADGGDDADPDRWHQGDELLVPMRDSAEQLLGILSVGEPADGRRPSPLRLQALAAVASHAALAVEQRQIHTNAVAGAALALELERERAAHLAAHDLLTGLPNRESLLAQLQLRIDDGAPSQVLFLDLNDFKIVNDALGHHDGDELLREVGVRLQTAAQPHLVSRLGGDEFAVLIAGAAGDAQMVAERIHAALRVPVAVNGAPHLVSAGIGIASATAGIDAPEVTKRADIAMYQAKAVGRATAVYDASTDQAASRLTTVASLLAAPERGELELHYQPIVCARDGQTVSLEALVRWRRDGQLVPPLDFIPLAESSGAIEPIGAWVIDEAARQSREWRDAGLAVPSIAVNVSPRQLRGGDLADNVRAALQRHDLDSAALSIELTESALLPDLRADAQLHELRELGVSCAIDDFGADYSSLHRLQHLPVDVLKIDRAFMREVPESIRATGLLHAIIGLAASLELDVVVEGIETAEQHAELRAPGSGLRLQGFYFSRPLPAEELAAWLAARLTRAA